MQVLLFDCGRIGDDRSVSAVRYARIGVCGATLLATVRKSMNMADFAAVRQGWRSEQDGETKTPAVL
ncbi:MAG: hypothetical protein ACJAVR_003916 [Paracoccaceae bacterium]|jgi:hypothetical protein